MKPEFKAALFDMDGTLLYTMRYWRLTVVELLLDKYNIIPTPADMARVFTTSGRKLTQEILRRNGIEKDEWDIVRELEGCMLHHYQTEAKPKPHVGMYLAHLQAKGIPMGIATQAPKEFAHTVLARLGLESYFSFITDCYAQGLRKDNPAFFRRIAKQCGVETHEMCVFEDALYAMQGAKAAGCKVVAIRDAIQEADWPEIQALADVCIADYAELMD